MFITCVRIHHYRAYGVLLNVAKRSQKNERYLCANKKCTEMVRVLNVAEKNDAAKSIAGIMAGGRFNRRNGRSVYNKIYEYDYNLFNQRCFMIMTSVSGHLLNIDFPGSYRKWESCNPVTLFEAPIVRNCLPDYQGIKETLELEVRSCQHLVIWTDGDREGENIGFEIIEVCKKVKPDIRIHRARFSEITSHAISRACANLAPPDKGQSDAVEVRRELDLRIGAAFTRFQTLRLKRVFPDVLGNQLISYGSCQFPTLGFVVERYKQVQAFVSEPFWKLRVTHKKEDIMTEFSWKRGRLFDHTACLVFYQLCLEDPIAKVTDIRSRPKSKWRPQPLDTVEFEKAASRKLRINAKEAMTIAEKLYTSGFISYPRTETTIFPKELNLTPLVEMQCQDPAWGAFAQRVMEQGVSPRQGTKTDNAHPPIHPTKYANNLQGKEKSVYDFIVRHFLACVSKDAEGRETTLEIVVNAEMFAANGLMIIARNYLDVYPYDKWNTKIIGEYNVNETFQPSSIEMNEGETSAPDLLTEADLIALMEKHGIGTDATHAEHIETIKSRLYVGVNENNRFVPGELGMGLVEGYDTMGFEMSKPHLRAELEADLKRISEGNKNPKVVLQEQIAKYKRYFVEAIRQAKKIDDALSTYLNTTPNQVVENYSSFSEVMKCPKCSNGEIVIKKTRDNRKFFLSCMSYPECNAAMWLPESVIEVTPTEEDCDKCRPRKVKKLKFKFKPGSLIPFYPDELINCIGGCDRDFLQIMNVNPISASRGTSTNPSASRNNSSDSGYDTARASSSPFHSDTAASSNTRNTNSSSTITTQRPAFLNITRPRAPLQPANHFQNGSNDSSSDVVCNCGKKAIVLTVRKENENKGRQFYKCPEMNEAARCDFFLWLDEANPGPAQNAPSSSGAKYAQRSYSDSSVNNNTSGGPLCKCSNPAKIVVTQKEGENKGRQFYACPKPREQQCKFFIWVDEYDPSDHSSNVLSSSNTMPRTNQTRRRPTASDSDSVPSKRKCGVCFETGHNRRNCPKKR